MKTKIKMIVSAIAVIGVSIIQPSNAQQSDFPSKSVRVIVPYGPGGGVDTFTRPLAIHLSQALGQQFIVDNRAGAGGTIGVKAAATAVPDGYTILSGGVHQPMAESLYPNRGYDMAKDFVPIALTAVVPNVLVVRPALPFKNVADLIAYAKANPGKLTFCSSGTGTSQHIIAEMFKVQTGVDMLHIPHKGTAAAMTTLLSGNCDMMFDGLATSISNIKGGNLKALALTTAVRSKQYPDIPTMTEAGGPSMDAGTWYGWWVPAATPPSVLAKLRKDLVAALKSPEINAAWQKQGADVPNVSTADVENYVREEIKRWIKTNQDAKIKVE